MSASPSPKSASNEQKWEPAFSFPRAEKQPHKESTITEKSDLKV